MTAGGSIMNNFIAGYGITKVLETYHQTHVHPDFSYFSDNILNNIFQQLYMPYNSGNWRYVFPPSNLFESMRQINMLFIINIDKLFG